MKTFLSNYINFSDEEYEHFISIANLKSYKKNEQLLSASKSADKLFFIKSGLVRGFRIIDGIEITHHFFIENWFATDYESFLTGQTGELFLETLTKTVVYEFHKKSLFEFFEKNPKFEKIRIIQAENAYLQMVQRLKEFQIKDLKARYESLINKSPKLFKLVPQKYIASYLGVAPQSLSRIKDGLRHS